MELSRFDLSLDGEVSIGLYDVAGRRVLNERVWSNGSQIELNIEKLERGTYTVIIDAPKR